MNFKIVYLPQNMGHGNARRKSVEECSNELIALMDADDVSFPHRFFSQLELFSKNEQLDVCGGHILEFVDSEDNIMGRRAVKLVDAEIKKDLKKRCPMNQVSVMFKKSSYYAAGGYVDFFCEEDYYLWARMVLNNAVFANVNSDIVNVRVGLNMSARRGGIKYFKSERKMQKYLLSKKQISFLRYLFNVLLRFCGEVLAPNWLRNKLFKATRKRIKNELNYLTTDIDNTIIDKYPPFSVAMCVYGKDNPVWFERALNSIIFDQIVKPSEVVLVVDGPVTDSIQSVIDKFQLLCNK